MHSKSQTLRFGDNKKRSEVKDKMETIKMEIGKKQKGKRNRKHKLETEFCRLFVVISLKASSIGRVFFYFSTLTIQIPYENGRLEMKICQDVDLVVFLY